jgi:prephenate dehydratase/prephenate dehydrogenase
VKHKTTNAQYLISLLGPPNSFSEEAALKVFPDNPFLHLSSIPEVIRSISSGEATFGVVPLENLLHGPVTETLDSLTEAHLPGNGKEENAPILFHSFSLAIEHYIGLPSRYADSTLEKIRIVYSHPQALSQSKKFLDTHLPDAERVPLNSTSIAPFHAKESNIPAAAIASKNALLAEGFHILEPTVPPHTQNQTRFGIVGLPKNIDLIKKHVPNFNDPMHPEITSLCIHPGRDRQGILLELLSIISETHLCNLLSIHSRPDSEGGFVFYFEIEGNKNTTKVKNCLKALSEYCRVQTGNAAKILLFGSYQRPLFKESKLQSICLVGAQGNMGHWLHHFFKEHGFKVLPIDKESTEEEKKKIADCDAVFLSVPMRDLKEISLSLLPYCKKGTLIIENCSVKSLALSTLREVFSSDFETIGIHTMFGPEIETLKGKNIIITRTPDSDEKAKALENLFYKHGAHIHHATPEEHDKATAFLQALCQFYALGMAEVLATLHNEIGPDLHHFVTPNSERALTSVSRVLTQSTLLTTDLQNENPFAKKIREEFIQKLTMLHGIFPEAATTQNKINDLNSILGSTLKKILEK